MATMNTGKTFYVEVLGMMLGLVETVGNSNAAESRIEAAFRRLVYLHHPEKGGDPRKFRDLCDARRKALSWVRQTGEVRG